MAKKKPTRRAAKRRATEQPAKVAAKPSELARRPATESSAPAPNAPQDPAASIDEGALTRDVIAECRLNLRQLKDAGDLLDRMYSRAALARRRALYFERHAAPKEVEYEITGTDGSTRSVRRAADYGGDSWACRQDWPSEAEPTKQLMDRMFAALHDVMDGWFHSERMPTVDRTPSAIVMLLHWLMTDESADSHKPNVCAFQSLPWFTGKSMLGRRTVGKMWLDSSLKAPWYRKVKEALEWARLDPKWVRHGDKLMRPSSIELRSIGDAASSDERRESTDAEPRLRRPPLTEHAKRVARVLVEQPEGVGIGRKQLQRKSGVPEGSLGRVLKALEAWGVQSGKKGAGYFVDTESNIAALRCALGTGDASG